MKDHLGRPLVAVTGIGLVSPLGWGLEKNWAALLAGTSGITRIRRFATDHLKTTMAGTVDLPEEVAGAEPVPAPVRVERMAEAAIAEALAKAGLQVGDFPGPLMLGMPPVEMEWPQRVALARALVMCPKMLLLDEPLSNLDAKLRLEMRNEIRRVCKDLGLTAIYVTHDQKEALSISDRMAILDAGRIAQVGTPEEVYRRPLTPVVADFIGETNFLSATIDGKKVRLATGDTVAASGVEAHSEGAAVTLAIRPEQVRVDDKGGLAATVAETVYFGTDTHLHLTLGDGSELVARLQSPPSGEIGLSPGAKVSVSFTEGAVQVLEH